MKIRQLLPEDDISEGGEYRIRISVGEVDMERSNMFVNNYDTKYAYFKIV